MSSIRKYILYAVFIFNSVLSFSQNVKDEIKLVRDAYLNNKQLSFDIEVYSYSNKADKTAELVSKGAIRKKDDKYYSKFQDYELLIIGEKALIVNNEEKTMKYYNYKLEKQKIPKQFDMKFDSIVMKTDSVIIRPTINELKHFTILSKNGYVKQTELYVDTKTNLISHLLYYYVSSTEEYEIEVDRVEVFYKNSKTQNVDESYFVFDKYFKLSKTTITPIGKYQNYKVNFFNSKS